MKPSSWLAKGGVLVLFFLAACSTGPNHIPASVSLGATFDPATNLIPIEVTYSG